MRLLTWAPKEVDPVGLHRQSTLSLRLELLRNKFKIAPHKQKSIVNKKKIGRKMGLLANGHNDKSGTVFNAYSAIVPFYLTKTSYISMRV